MHAIEDPSLETHYQVLTTRLNELSTSTRQDPDVVSVNEVLTSELDHRLERLFAGLSAQKGICEVVHNAAKKRVIINESQRSVTKQQILAFTQEIQNASTSDDSGNRFITISKLYSVLFRSSPGIRKWLNSGVIGRLVADSRSSSMCISCQVLSDFLLACCRREQQHLLLLTAAKQLDYISTEEITDLIMAEVSRKIPWDKDCQNYPFYYAVFAERYICFHMDPQKIGKISISELAATRLLDDLFEVLGEQDRDSPRSWDAPSSWCSVSRFLRVLNQFRICDRDNSGMISLRECHDYREGTVTPLFLERVYACSQLYGERPQEMDFRMFVDMDIAITSRNLPGSLRWLFRVLDLRNDGILTRDEIKLMTESMLEHMAAHDTVDCAYCKADDIVDEIIDMINPAKPDRISLDDVLASTMGDVAFGIMIEYPAFMRYETREEEAGSS